MSFVIPTIYTAIDKYSHTVEAMSKKTSSFADRAVAASARIERGFDRFGDKALKVSAIAGGMGLAIVAPLGYAVKKAVAFEDRLADIAKTTGLTGAELDQFGKDIRKMSHTTRTSIEDLATIGEIGGRLGVASNELLAFTAASDKFAIALASDYGGGVEAAITNVSKLQGLFEETRKIPIADAITKIGSVINELGGHGKGTSENINDFMLRMGALPDVMKPSITDIAALGGFLEKAGIDSQIASGGLTNFFTVANKNMGGFASQMHMSAAAAKQLFATDPTEFAKKFASSLNGMSADKMAVQFQKLGIGSQETLKVIGSLSSNIAGLTEVQNLAASAFANGTSLSEEAAKKNATLAAKWEQAKNIAADLAISVGDKLVPVLGKLMDKVAPMITSVIDWMDKNEGLVSSLTHIAGTFGGLLLTLSVASGVIGTISKAVAAWNVVQKALNITMSANIVGIIVLSLWALYEAIDWVIKNTEGWGKQWDATIQWIKDIFNACKLELIMGWFYIADKFQTMVDVIVKAWYWAQNKMGIISDEQYNKNIAQIAAEQEKRKKAYADIAAEHDRLVNKVMAGPGIHIGMKTDRKDDLGIDSGGIVAPSILKPLPTSGEANQSQLMQALKMPSWKDKSKVEVTIKAPPGVDPKVTKNPSGIPVATSSTMDSSGGYGRFNF